ncbi:glycosyltransferase family 4 protein [Pseudoblastomonas halimionae]|uniref:Glycosyltransferase n=1 Tax=Alteriqipengyuania halimionae TaxID=1926630 RepID=A0A6I4U253_9SPHN|nr:glycosyltransferase family 1 protein [Alteriqipengyuania halimionae]MXP10100.1 glycosyltransferase [Alteriqipengyuania halimionae]
MAEPHPIAGTRIALFSGNYNYEKDGANQALNRLVGYLLRQGAEVKVFSPTTDTPAFEPEGELHSLPSKPIPTRTEYQFPLGLSEENKATLEAFDPQIVHLSSPDVSGHRALTWARKRGIPTVASVHTRFETYPAYYGAAWAEKPLLAIMRRYYNRCDIVLAPTEVIREEYRKLGLGERFGIWQRGVDKSIFNPGRRDLEWRREMGIADDAVAIGYLGRLVLEKGLGQFAEVIGELRERGVKHEVLVIGEGPARDWFAERVPDARFAGFQIGEGLARAVAGMDVLLNASSTEGFSNVTLESMACAHPVVAVDTIGSDHLVQDGVNGRLIERGNIAGFADALEAYCKGASLREAHGQAALARAHEFDWDGVNDAVAQTYLELLKERG